MGFEYDVFVSYASADRGRMERLAVRLQEAGLRVWFDRWAVAPGEQTVAAIERGLEASRVLLLGLSRAAVVSEWVGPERSTAMFRDPLNQARRFVPLLLEDCEEALPDTLRGYQWIDLRGRTTAHG